MAEEKTIRHQVLEQEAEEEEGRLQARRKKEFTYRGFTMEQLLEMPFDEVLDLMPSRARRSFVRGLNEEQKTAFEKIKSGEGRSCGRTAGTYPSSRSSSARRWQSTTGRNSRKIEIKPEMIGHFLGEFAMTGRTVKHSGPGVGATRGRPSSCR